jgi:DNA-binding Lrp family transcriptional regulator
LVLQAYVLIQTEAGKAVAAVDVLAGLDGVSSVAAVSGPYDMIAVTEAADADELGRLITGTIQAVEGVTRTLTCPVVRL